MKPEAMVQNKHYYAFDEFLVDESARALRRAGEPVPLTPKAFEMLIVLVSHAGLVMSKEDLMESVWPDAFVEEANLAVNISMLRKALGEMPDGGQYIETLPRRGYRFAAEVIEFDGERAASQVVALARPTLDQSATPMPIAASSAAIESSQSESEPVRTARLQRLIKHKAFVIAAVAALFITIAAGLFFATRTSPRSNPQTRRLAVLPFTNNRPSEETDYLGFALADSVINKLDYVKALVVSPSSYVEKYTRQKKEPEEIAKELDVNTLLMGSYVKDGDDLVVNAQLIDVTSGQKLWSEAINGKYDKLLELQDYVARQVVNGLRLNLTAAEGERFDRNQSRDPVAYEYFLRSRFLLSTNNHRKAIELLTESVRIDPNFALAWAYLARAYHINALQFSGSRAELSEAEADYDQALELDPELPQARLMKAKLLTETGRVEQSVPLLLQLVKANPNLADAHWELSYAYRYAGLLNESIEAGERALQIDTRQESHQFNSYLYTGQYKEFMASLPVREDAYVMFYRGFGYYYLNDLNRAAAAFDRAYELNQSSVISQLGKALRLGLSGKHQEGLGVLKAAEAGITKSQIGDGEISYKFAQAYDGLGDKESALRAFSRCIEQGFFCYPYFVSDPLLKRIRNEAGFTALLERARQRHEAFKRKLEEIK
jgi:DNA-binding winged helix-turn-helix (wHTH) protein/TolB-like protein